MRLGGLLLALLWPHVAMADDPQPKPEPSHRPIIRDCQLSVWGCTGPAGGASSGSYDQIVARARAQLLFGQLDPGKNVESTVTELREATRQSPARSEAWVQLAVLYAETGACPEGLSLFERLLAMSDSHAAETSTELAPLSWKERQSIQLGLGLCLSRRGDLDQAATIYRRMLLTDGPSQRVLYRLGDVLLASGFPSDAAQVFQKACLEVAPLQPLVNVGRSCLGLLVALDRTQQRQPGKVLSQFRRYDWAKRCLKMTDFVSPTEADYYRALTLSPGCEKVSLLARYLQNVGPTVPSAYRRRAEANLAQALAEMPSCKPTATLPTTPAAPASEPPNRPPVDDFSAWR